MAKPTFIPRTKNGLAKQPVAFSPLIYIVGSEAHKLALHRSVESVAPKADWVVSHPGIGAKIALITGEYKGVPVSSKDLNSRQAREAAIATLDALVNRIGSDKFNATIREASCIGSTPTH